MVRSLSVDKQGNLASKIAKHFVFKFETTIFVEYHYNPDTLTKAKYNKNSSGAHDSGT